MRCAAVLMSIAALTAPAAAREAVDASAPENVAVTIYRDPNRGPGDAMNRDWPQGFAMISETRTVTVPSGESTIRFEGVSEGMVAVTAIVTGLPGGTIEKNRNADLLSPGALVDGSLGNRVTITRTDPATGRETSEPAIVRTRADGGLVLQTAAGFEAVGCAGLPEKLAFDRVPKGLSARPVFSIDAASPQDGTYTVTLTYLSWGFDWQAHYVATLEDGGSPDRVRMRLASWLTLLNDNGQSFPDAELMAVAGSLRVESDYRELAEPPAGKSLRLLCYPFGGTARGSPVGWTGAIPPAPPPPPPMAAPAPVSAMADEAIMVTGSRVSRAAMVAREEDLADLKLYRVPKRVTVAAQSQKQIAFLDREGVEGTLWHTIDCAPWSVSEEARPTGLLLATVNDTRHGLGAALPTGGITVFESTPAGDLLIGEQRLRDYASGQDVELEIAQSTRVHARCVAGGIAGEHSPGDRIPMFLVITNANPGPIRLRVGVGSSSSRVDGLRGTRIKDGERVFETTVRGNDRRTFSWTIAAE